ncbi:hypothetical protein GCM10009745_41100 [Kribbella yunnanensis]|uniref:Uncharacterized protein n=1 Tax=Kribbella yunnanensis TaxID=190194 RepID=A0ABN2HQ04_9ACTN
MNDLHPEQRRNLQIEGQESKVVDSTLQNRHDLSLRGIGDPIFTEDGRHGSVNNLPDCPIAQAKAQAQHLVLIDRLLQSLP